MTHTHHIKLNIENRGTWTLGDIFEKCETSATYTMTEDERGFNGWVTFYKDGRIVASSSSLNFITDNVNL